jgi:PilZ domain
MSGQLAPAVPDARHYPCEVQTTCQPPSGWRKDPWPAVIRDISTGGLCLRLGRRFERGAGLAIDLPTEQGGTTTVLARVHHVEAGEGGWLLACTFISELSGDEVRAVLGIDPARLDGPDVPRPPGAPSIHGVLFHARAAGEVVRWYVKRLDLTGSWPLPEGRVVSFRLLGRAGAGLAADLVIKKCRLIGAHWIVDCSFRDDPTREVVRALAVPPGP